MNIQTLGATNSARQSYAENNLAATPAANTSAATNQTKETENSGPATPVDSSKAVERNATAPSLEKVHQAVQSINKSLQSMSRDLEFSVDSDSNRTIVKIVDNKTKEVIRQIPSQEALEISKALDTVRGLLIKQQA